MKPVELEIIKSDGKKASIIVEFKRQTDAKTVLTVARQLKAKCNWKKVRVGLGQDWSNWQ